MFDILIVDDEQPARDRLRRLILAMAGYRVAGEAGSGAEALGRIRELDPDIVLLDGMALARALQEAESAPSIVFCTAYQDQALRAFEVEAVDYVVKPVRAERLERALLKASRYLGGDEPDEQEHFLRSTVGGTRPRQVPKK